MAEAIISGLLKSEAVLPSQITATDVDGGRLDHIHKTYGVEVAADSATAVRDSRFVIMAVKSRDFREALAGFAGELGPGHLLITIAAGVSVARIRSLLQSDIPIVRVMPNTPALVNAGVSAIAMPPGMSASDRDFVQGIFAAVGSVVLVEEADMNGVTAVSGSGPAYFFLFVKELIEAAVKTGLTRELAVVLVRETFFGSAALLKAGSMDEQQLITAVTSPGGTTESALKIFAGANFAEIVENVVAAAAARARELDS